MSDSLQDYRTLGVRPGCTIQALKAARRRLVKSWHPDRFQGEATQQAEQRIKEINTAFDRLIAYYENFGVLPNDHTTILDENPSAKSSTAQEQSSPAATSTDTRPRPRSRNTDQHYSSRLSFRWRSVLAIIVSVLALNQGARMIFNHDQAPKQTVESRMATPETPIQNSPSPPSIAARASVEYFTVGSSIGEVYAIQGVPSTTEDGIWHYGNSTVYFSDGLVTGWNHDSSYPLKVALPPYSDKPALSFFTLGSTRAEVRAIQGTPLVETDALWDFGLSKIYFQDGRVIGWDSSPMYPLKARK